MGKTILLISVLLILNSLKLAAQLTLKENRDSAEFTGLGAILPQNFYNQHLGFFCKKESQLQKHTNLNLYMRLGSKDYVDYLERKPNAKKNF